MGRPPLAVRVAAPFVVALLISGWLLWTRGASERQGGYCVNATVVLAGVLQKADTGGDVGRGPLPDVDAIFGAIRNIDVDRLQVHTPPAVRTEVTLLAHRIPRLRETGAKTDPDAAAAFAKVAADYLQRCRTGTA
jgi:hypothetical protein